MGNGVGLENSKPTLRDASLPTWPYLLFLPKQFHLLGIQTFKYAGGRGTLILVRFNHPMLELAAACPSRVPGKTRGVGLAELLFV